jgi:putative flippase GtrA
MSTTLGQLIRYGIVGVLSNLLAYLIYLGLTMVGLEPKLAMSLVYLLGIVQTFFLNKNWSFHFDGAMAPALFRYIIIYLLGYLINILTLLLLVDTLGFPHQWVMAGLIVFMALFFFVGQKFWAFRASPTTPTGA